jgi:hypothetical protein
VGDAVRNGKGRDKEGRAIANAVRKHKDGRLAAGMKWE